MTPTMHKVGDQMARINDIDRRVLATLTGRDRLKALLGERGFTLRAFAEKHNLWVENVSRCLSGERSLPEIRDAIASELELDRSTVDRLIDGEAA